VLLATAATAIASQAVITGAYSVSWQAVQLGFLPRLRIEHTSEEEIGQVYNFFRIPPQQVGAGLAGARAGRTDPAVAAQACARDAPAGGVHDRAKGRRPAAFFTPRLAGCRR
jgi:hypothetical protein